jgi:Leucine-rich repeat (LRR) protein
VIDSTEVWHSSLVLDDLGYPHIAYDDSTNGDLKYATKRGVTPGFGNCTNTDWNCESIDVDDDTGAFPSLVLDSLGNPHISYHKETPVNDGDLKYATKKNVTPGSGNCNNTNWNCETIDATGDVGWDNALALDSADNLHISYYDWTNSILKYAFNDGGSWQISTIDSSGNVGPSSSIKVDEMTGNPHVSYYYCPDLFVTCNLNYAYHDGLSWQIETIDSGGDVGWTSSIALDWMSEHQHFSYHDGTNGDLKYALRSLPEQDCNDNDNTVYPGAPELCDAQLNDCNGVTLSGEFDVDGDGYVECAWVGSDPTIDGGDDCNNNNNTVYPGATEVCGDALDNNCDTNTDEAGCSVIITDANFEQCVRDELVKPTGDITDTDLASISTLDCSNKNIQNIEGAQYLTSLTLLFLHGNQISDISALSGLTSLTELHLYVNQITNVSALSGLTNLTSLYLDRNNQLSDISALSGLTSLTFLSLYNTQISDISALSGLTSLNNLYLYDNQITNVSALSGLTSLTVLSLHSNQITNVSALSGLTSLVSLYLDRNQISDISALSGFPSLTVLSLYSNQISDISALSGLSNLFIVYLENNCISNFEPVLDPINDVPNVYGMDAQGEDGDSDGVCDSVDTCVDIDGDNYGTGADISGCTGSTTNR